MLRVLDYFYFMLFKMSTQLGLKGNVKLLTDLDTNCYWSVTSYMDETIITIKLSRNIIYLIYKWYLKSWVTLYFVHCDCSYTILIPFLLIVEYHLSLFISVFLGNTLDFLFMSASNCFFLCCEIHDVDSSEKTSSHFLHWFGLWKVFSFAFQLLVET